MKAKKILIINQGNVAGNIGDMAIRKSIGNLFCDMGCQIDFSFFNDPSASVNKESLPGHNYFKVDTRQRRKNFSKKTLKAYLSIFYWLIKNKPFIESKLTNNVFDAFVIGGGQLINASHATRRFPYIYPPHVFSVAMFWWIYLIRKHTQAPIYLIAVGAEGGFNKIEKYLYKKAFNKVEKIWVRDSYSKKVLLEELRTDSILMPDVAFYKSDTKEIEPSILKKEIALVGIYDYVNFCYKFNKKGLSLHDYYNEWYGFIEKYKAEGFMVKLFYTTKGDSIESKRFKTFLFDTRGEDVEIVDISDLDDLYKLLLEAKIVCSARMHALLLALKCDCKVHPYVISQKIKSFCDEYINVERGPKAFSEDIKNTFKKVQLIKQI